MNKKIKSILKVLFALFFIYPLAALPFAFIYDSNVSAICMYPLYILLDTLSGYFRYSALFPYLAAVPLILLGITTIVVVGIIKILKDKEINKSLKVIYPLLGIVLLVVIFRVGVPNIVEDFQLVNAENEKSIVIKSDEVKRTRNKRQYHFIANFYEKQMTLDFTSYQYYKIRKANEEQNGRSIRVHYFERQGFQEKVFAYELLDKVALNHRIY